MSAWLAARCDAGHLGEMIQAWRQKYDARHAARLPPHLTLCYRPPNAPLEVLIAVVQAYVFALLASIYLNDAINLH